MKGFLVALIGLSLALMSCGRLDDSPEIADGNTDNIFQLKDVSLHGDLAGKRLFIHYCSFCHGESGQGDGLNAWNLTPRPRDFTDNGFMSSITNERLNEVISQGGMGVGKSKSMPPWDRTLSAEKIRRIIAYIRTLSKTDARE